MAGEASAFSGWTGVTDPNHVLGNGYPALPYTPTFASEYEDRLQQSYLNEKSQLAGLQRDNDARRNTLAARMIGSNQAALYGNAVGAGAAGMRGATYASADMRQGIHNQVAAQKAIEDQAMMDYYRQLQQRRGQYNNMAMGGATKLYEIGADASAAAVEAANERSSREAKEDADEKSMWIGLASGIVGAGGAAASG